MIDHYFKAFNISTQFLIKHTHLEQANIKEKEARGFMLCVLN